MHYFLYVIAFFIDIAFALVQHQFSVCFLRPVFYATFFTVWSAGHVLLGIFLLVLQSFIIYGNASADLMVLIPFAMLIIYARTKLAMSRILSSIMVLILVAIHYFIVDYWVFLKRYSLESLLTNFAAYGIVIGIILSSHIRGNQDNRLMS